MHKKSFCILKKYDYILWLFTVIFVDVHVVLDEWKMWPILIHDKKSLLNPEHIILDGLGKTIHLQCTASAYSNNSSLVVFQTFSMQGFPFSLIATKCLPFKCTIKYRDCCLFFLSFPNTSLDFIHPPMISTDIEQDLKYCQLYDLSRLNFTSPAC